MAELQTPSAPAQTPSPAGTRVAPKKKNGKKTVKRVIAIIVAAAIILGIVLGLYFLVFRKSGAQGDIYFENAYIGSIQSTVQGSGNATSKDAATITVPSAGTVEALYVTSGDMVTAGQPLFSIYSEAAQAKFDQAQEQVSRLYEKMNNLTLRAPFAGKLLDVTEFNTGDTVGEGATVATLVNDKKLKMSLYFSYAYDGQVKVGQAANISVPAAMYTTAAGKVEKINRVSYITPEGGIYFEVILSFDNPGTLTADMEASAVLFAADGTPIYPYSDGKTEYYETRALTTKAGGPLIKSSLLNYANVTSGQALLTMSSETLDAELATARETLAAAQADLDTLNATAPIDGTIISCTLVEGGEVKAGDAVITISNTATMVVKITVDDRNIGFLKLGDTINLSDYNGNSYMGTVTNIDTQGTVGQGMSTFPVTLEVENYDGSLYSGAWLNYSFVTSQSEDCVLVPTTAVKSVLDTEGNKQTVVFVYRDEKPENTVELDASITNVPTEKDHYYPVAVVTGISDAKAVEIKSGIQDGDQVFINYTVSESSSSWGNY